MKDELKGDFIAEFVSGGAKNYAYKTDKEKMECKVKGLTLDFATSEVINFDTMKQNVLDEVQAPLLDRRKTIVTNPNFFVRHPMTKQVGMVARDKTYQLVFDARVICPTTFTSFAYGYRRVQEENAMEESSN